MRKFITVVTLLCTAAAAATPGFGPNVSREDPAPGESVSAPSGGPAS